MIKLRDVGWSMMLGATLATGGAAQEEDSFLLPAGTIRFSAGGEYGSFDAVYGGSGSEAAAAVLASPLQPTSFPPLRPLQSSLTTFLSSTAGAAGATPFALRAEDITLGTPDASVFFSSVHAPYRLDVGLPGRLQIGVTLPVVRGRQLVERLALEGALVGLNPNPGRNATLLGRVGGNGSALGALTLLPTKESPAGQELQRRVAAATNGDTLSLPRNSAVGAATLNRLLIDEFGVAPLNSNYASRWQLGDAEIDLRMTVLDGLAGALLPTDSSGRSIRLAIFGGARIGTGSAPDTLTVFPIVNNVGVSGVRGGAIADFFMGDRWWTTISARHSMMLSRDVLRRVVPGDARLSSTEPAQVVSWNPPDTLQLRITPRFRLTELISLGLDYEAGWTSESVFEGSEAAAVLNGGGGLSQAVGFGVRFTAVPAYIRRQAALPLDITLRYRRSIAGPDGFPVVSTAEIQGSILARAWGAGFGR